jgi:hypothetical protein
MRAILVPTAVTERQRRQAQKQPREKSKVPHISAILWPPLIFSNRAYRSVAVSRVSPLSSWDLALLGQAPDLMPQSLLLGQEAGNRRL